MKVNVTNQWLGEVTIRVEEEAFDSLPQDVKDELILYTLRTCLDRHGRYCEFDVRHWLAPGLIGRLQAAVGFAIDEDTVDLP